MNDKNIEDQNGIEICAIIKRIWSWKARIIIATIFFGVIGCIIAYLIFPASYTTSCQFAMQFDGITNWRNPDNSPFDPHQIIAPHLLLEAAKQAYPDKQIKNLSKYTSIEPIIPFDIQNKIRASKKKQEDFAYFPTQFCISITTRDQTEITPQEKAKILDSLYKVYRAHFERKFGQLVLKDFIIEKSIIENSEYLENIRMFKMMANNLISFIDSKIASAGGKFRSPKSGLTFSQIRDNLLFFSEIEIRTLETIVRKSKVARDKQHLINYFEIDIRNKEIERIKAQNEAETALKLLEMEKAQQLVKSESENISASNQREPKTITSLTIDHSLIENLKKSEYVPQLVFTVLKAQAIAKNCEVDIEYLKRDIKEFSDESAVQTENINKIEKALQTVFVNLQGWTEKLMELDNEYTQTQINEAIRPISLPESGKYVSRYYKLSILFFLCLPLFFSILLAFLIEETGKKISYE